MTYVPSATPQGGSLQELADAVTAGTISTVVILGGNPVYASGAMFDVAAMLEAADSTIHVGFHYDETGRACSTHLPEAHALESWGDLQSADGQTAIVQPVIEPLYPSISPIDVVAQMVGESGTTLELIQAFWRRRAGGPLFDAEWRRWLHEGVTNVVAPTARPSFSWSGLTGDSSPMPSASSLEVTFVTDSKVYDGRYSNNSWLQELPDPISKLTWDNAALMNPLTARELGISFGNSAEPTDGDRYEEDLNIPSTLRGDLVTEMVTVTVNGRSLDIPAFVVPGVAENTVAISLGYGREWGTVSTGVGFDAYQIADDGEGYASGVSVVKAGGSYKLATTQDHGSMEGRPLIREATTEEYASNPEFATQTIFEGGPELMAAEDLHSLWEPPNVRDGQQWGMSIDLTTCIGCNACTAACNAENNISVVGKERVLEGREMHWIRLDRYFSGDPAAPDVHMQPVGCMHCENAPCEQVCPVAATVHGPEGTNDMAYNRCIGTRYCANNCPYKVRRFNFYNFSRENDHRNPLLRLQKNADVTVRFRGVMEKCSYCVQRINGAKIDAKVNSPDAHVADGAIVTACQQACPTGAIIFGDINDPSTRVSHAKALDRDYSLLSWVNSHPRTTYLARITNPNPELS
jgi:molybdopterin-containing oxidoreductase family iron-sulfur binding subunit